MARQARRTNPGDAANIFVRVILADAGALLGGFTEEEWERTVEHFGGQCAYTGADLAEGQVDRDHAIPLSRAHCGVHLFGNVLPAAKAANSKKGGKHYRQFVEDEGVLEKIESFRASSGYEERVSVFGDLRNYCEAQYRTINALCRVNKNYLESLLPPDMVESLLPPDVETDASDRPSQENRRVLADRITGWSRKPHLNVHKIIALVAGARDDISRGQLVRRVGEVTRSKNPYGAVASLLTDSGSNYGRVFADFDGIIRIHPEVEDQVRKLTWKAGD